MGRILLVDGRYVPRRSILASGNSATRETARPSREARLMTDAAAGYKVVAKIEELAQDSVRHSKDEYGRGESISTRKATIRSSSAP